VNGIAQWPSLFMARPMKLSNPACLQCHDTAEDAPKTMIEKYGAANASVEVERHLDRADRIVPTQLANQRARGVFVTFMISLARFSLYSPWPSTHS